MPEKIEVVHSTTIRMTKAMRDVARLPKSRSPWKGGREGKHPLINTAPDGMGVY
jgi:hypothetical protein